jgi:hypothetical protein
MSDAWNNHGVSYAISGNQPAAPDTVAELRCLNPETVDEGYK